MSEFQVLTPHNMKGTKFDLMNAYCEMFCTISKYAGYPEEERREARKAIKAYQLKNKDEDVEFEMPTASLDLLGKSNPYFWNKHKK